MEVFVRNGKRYRAWSEMKCRDAQFGNDHGPHSWDGEYTMYGPYFCEGFPVYKPKHRKDGPADG
jgi:hypothetical protein